MFLQLSIYQITNNIIIILLLLIGVEASAENIGIKPKAGKLYIQSDSLTIYRSEQKIEYAGKVVVHFDDAVLTTDKLYVIYKIIGSKQTIDHVVIPNKLIVRRESSNELLIADSAQYYLETKQLILLGNVILQREDNIFKTNKLIYYVNLKQGL